MLRPWFTPFSNQYLFWRASSQKYPKTATTTATTTHHMIVNTETVTSVLGGKLKVADLNNYNLIIQ
jgi:hypothetical protein